MKDQESTLREVSQKVSDIAESAERVYDRTTDWLAENAPLLMSIGVGVMVGALISYFFSKRGVTESFKSSKEKAA